jgi:hypothetical protein
MEQLQRELRDVKRELAAALRALQGRRGRPGPEATVRALAVVLQHSVPAALAEAQRDRERLAEELRHTQASLRTQKDWYSQLRCEVWRLA